MIEFVFSIAGRKLFQYERAGLLVFLACVCLLSAELACPTVLLAQRATGRENSAAVEEKDASSFRIKIRRLQQSIMNQESQMAESRTKERDILEELEVIDAKLVKQQEKLKDLEAKMQKQQALINKEEDALRKIGDKKGAVEEHLKKRITAYYTMGDIGLLNVSFSAKTLPELLAFHDAFENLIKYDKQVFKSYLDTITEIERTKNALDLEKAVLQEFIKQLVEENDILEKTKNEKQVLLTNVRTKEKLQKLAIDEMQQATEQLSRSMVEQKSKSEVSEERFLARKGSLPSPVDGAIITNFGQEKVNSLGIPRKSEGIELKAPDGTRVSAVAEGEVIFSGYLRGYGNTVIIHHGWQYYTVTSRMEKLLVAKGQQVKAETPIGIMGDTAMLFDEGLYFEIRRGRQPMDPLVWLNPNRISTQHELSPESSGNKNTSIH